MLIIGLTGSIATGKSTVSSLLSSLPHNIPIIDADVLARKVVEPGSAGYKAIVNYFGPSTPDLLLPPGPDASSKDLRPAPLNRPALGRRVFGDSEERKRDRTILNKIVHPAVRWEVYKSLLYYYLRGHWAVVLDVPLLFESGMDVICGTVIVVAVKDPAVQMRRLRERDPHLSAEDAENRVRSQGEVREKVRKALFRNGSTSSSSPEDENTDKGSRGVVVWNDADKAQLSTEVTRAIAAIRQHSPKWWSWLLLLAPPLGVAAAVWNMAINFSIQRSWDQKTKRGRAKL
jgi:dephospho-CoA kinase